MQFTYFHGQPGSPAELQLGRPDGWSGATNLFAPDRGQDRPELPLGRYFDHLAGAVIRRFPAGPIRLVGFSLGGFVATEVALRLAQMEGDRSVRLDLISTAAPLELGNFLPDMAGGVVFSLAKAAPPLFTLLTLVQAGVAQIRPGALFAQMFADVAGGDAALASSPAFQNLLQEILRRSFAKGARGYRREVLGYVAQRRERLLSLKATTTLWHGEADTWAPPSMARAIVDARPASRQLRTSPELSHYSTLQRVLPEIFADLS